ncbi:hypothetical protein [Ancylobacter pratisalsi]|nr:hypothetical protein [Ancylobacter pratisalsi]
MIELPGVDHFSFATRPDLINAIIDDFRLELSTPRGGLARR